MAMDRSSSYKYRYDPNDRMGSICLNQQNAPNVQDDDPNVQIGFSNASPSSHRMAMELVHRNYLPLNMVHLNGNVLDNKVVDSSDPRRHVMLYKRAEMSYNDYSANLRGRGIYPISPHWIIPDNFICYYIPEQYRVLVKGAMDFVLYIHSKNEAMIFPPNGTLEFGNLAVGCRELLVVEVDLEYVDPMDRVKQRWRFSEDWGHVRSIIIKMLGGNVNSLPIDMRSLVNDLSIAFHIRNAEDYFENHQLPLLKHGERRAFIENMYRKQSNMESQGRGCAYVAAVTGMGPFSGWRRNIFMDPNRYVPSLVRSCYGANTKYNDTDPSKANIELLRCMRNLSTHLHQDLETYRKNYAPSVSFGELDIDVMLMATFGGEIAAFHCHMCHVEITLAVMRD